MLSYAVELGLDRGTAGTVHGARYGPGPHPYARRNSALRRHAKIRRRPDSAAWPRWSEAPGQYAKRVRTAKWACAGC